ncbi:MAG TPA: hypothetical protein VF818_04970 [Ktedonobacterales bacterium]
MSITSSASEPHTQRPRKKSLTNSRLLRHLMMLGGIAAVAVVALTTATSTANASTFIRYQRGLSVQRGWLCIGFANGAIHCTRHWHRDRAGNLISDNPAWVPTSRGVHVSGGAARFTVSHTRYSPPAPAVVRGGEPCSPNVPSSVWTTVQYWRPGAIPPGCYGGVFSINPRNYVYRPYFGVCNWWPEVLRPDEPTLPYDSRLPHHSTPRAGGTVHYAPGDHGAGSTGHWGHVESISPDGRWILTSEMNMYWRGGGFGRVIYRYVNIDSGMYFIW